MDSADIYFLFSKLLALAFMPGALMALGLALAFLLLFTTFARAGRRLLGLVLGCYLVFGMLPVGPLLISVLEQRFPTVQQHKKPVSGIIVLGGSEAPRMTRARDQVNLGGAADRLTEFMRLGRKHPGAQLMFSGGVGTLSGSGLTEAQVAKRFFTEQGFAVDRVQFEDAARNTFESAELTLKTLKPASGEHWVLVTSAAHMPRAVGLFRHAGWDVTAHPVDYQTLPKDLGLTWPPNLGAANAAAHEWGGLLVAWMRGYIDEPFPGPQPVAQVKP